MKQNNRDLQNRLKTSDRVHKLNSKVFTGSVQKEVHPHFFRTRALIGTIAVATNNTGKLRPCFMGEKKKKDDFFFFLII